MIGELLDYYRPGGAVLWVIFGGSVLMWVIMVERLLFLRTVTRAVAGAGGKPVFSLLNGVEAELELRAPGGHPLRRDILREILLRERSRFGRGETAVSVLTALLPLLGLLGTVVGMIALFDALASFDLRHGSMVSDGIAQALLTTEAGLLTALPGVFILQYIRRRSRSVLHEFKVMEKSRAPGGGKAGA